MSTETLTREKPTAATVAATMTELGRKAREAAAQLALASSEAKVTALKASAAAVRNRQNDILGANADDVAAAKAAGIGAALIDRLALDPKRLEGVAKGLEDIAALPDPVGRVLAEWTRPNGLKISRVAVPLGVIGIIYESRPNVTADAGGLVLKSGNVAILRGGSESFHSSRALVAALPSCPRKQSSLCRRATAMRLATCSEWPASSISSCRAAARH
jgi:glutamate-5-semialdehyde dehydrogenase